MNADEQTAVMGAQVPSASATRTRAATISCPRGVGIPSRVRDAIADVPIFAGRRVAARPMSGGLSNDNWLVQDEDGRKYFVKVPGLGTGWVDRTAGNQGAKRASDLGIGAKVHSFDPATGVEVTEFLEGYETSTTTSLRTLERSAQVMRVYRTLHGSGPFANTNTLFDQTDVHLAEMRERGMRLPDWAEGLMEDYREVKARFLASGLDLAPCHNDPMPGNFMVKGSDMKIIDFEMCGNNDVSCELGLYFTEMFFDDDEMQSLIEEHYGTTSAQLLNRVKAARVIGDFKWGMWGLLSSKSKQSSFDYWKYGLWKLMRAISYRNQSDWDAVKRGI